MTDRSPNAWIYDDGQWYHRPALKRWINFVLRLLQPGVRFKFVIVSRCVGYGFGRVEHRSP